MQIHIKDIVVSGVHGCFTHEKEKEQRFRVSVDITLTQEPENDLLEEAVDWADIRNIIIRSVQKESFSLVETLAQHTAKLICAYDAKIGKVKIHIAKLDAWDNGVPNVTYELINK